MPVKALLCPKTEKEIPFQEAPMHFERMGIMQAETVQAMIDNENQHRRMGTSLSPSIMDPSTNCRREIAIKKFLDYLLNPLDMWEANEGTIWHASSRAAGAKVPGWDREILIPDPDVASHVENPAFKWDERGVAHLEIFPGILCNGMIDGLSDDHRIIKDLKTKRYPYLRSGKDATPREYGISEDWVTQLNVYRRMVEIVYFGGEEGNVEELRLWRQYRGSRRKDLTHKCFGRTVDADGVEHDESVPILTNEELEFRIREHCNTTTAWLNRCLVAKANAERTGEDPVPHIIKVIEEIPMDGLPMFRGQKCHQWCSVNKICYSMANLATF